MRDEFEKALNELKDRKAPGIDEIPEFFKNIGENVKEMLYELANRIYTTGKIPQDFTKYIIMLISKKARANNYNQYRTLSFLSYA